MKYELARELKDAGFPFKPADATYQGEVFVYPTEGKHNWQTPTLSELIEACGDEFKILTRDTDLLSSLTNLPWAALRNLNGDALGLGATPKEAVARLWLALNKKEKPTNSPAEAELP